MMLKHSLIFFSPQKDKSFYSDSADIEDYSNNGYETSGRLNISNDSVNLGSSSTGGMQIEDPDVNTNYSSYVSITHRFKLFPFVSNVFTV